jgi:GNAT superfamily N-acetyltransferase
MSYTVTKDEYTVSDNKSKIDINYTHSFLSQSYWSPGIIIETVKRAMENSLAFALYDTNKQIGCARVITDKTSFAYLADVFIDENYRGKGLGRWLIQAIFKHRICKV